MRYALLGLPCLALALLACGRAPGELTGVKLGPLMNTARGLRLRAEASRLPLVASRPGNTDKNFGLCFHYKEPTSLGKVSILINPPAAIRTSNATFNRERVGNGVRLNLEPFANREGDFCQEMFFEAGDPPGRWRFTLLRDDAAVKTFDVDVYRP